MSRAFRNPRSPWILVWLLIAGMLVGGAITEVLANTSVWPWLKAARTFGLTPTTLDLYCVTITVGFQFILSPFTVLGLLGGYWLYRRI